METKSINTFYLKRYINFVFMCIENNKNLPKDTYTENHHIVPKSKTLWPEYGKFSKHPWNKAKLTARQHVIAHIMLSRAIGGPMTIAIWSMVNGKCEFYRGKLKVNSRLVARAREDFATYNSKRMKQYYKENPEARENISKRTSGELNPFYGKKHTEETKTFLSGINTGKIMSQEVRDQIKSSLLALERKLTEEQKKEISERQSGEGNSFFGKTHTEETRKRISESNKGRPSTRKGIPISEEHKEKISNANKGKKLSDEHKEKIGNAHRGKIVSDETRKKISEHRTGSTSPRRGIPDKKITCPYCNKEGGISIMKRWHFEHCRNKGEEVNLLSFLS